jgi:hypothetical protein
VTEAPPKLWAPKCAACGQPIRIVRCRIAPRAMRLAVACGEPCAPRIRLVPFLLDIGKAARDGDVWSQLVLDQLSLMREQPDSAWPDWLLQRLGITKIVR